MLKKLVKKISFFEKLYRFVYSFQQYIRYWVEFDQFSKLQKKSENRFRLDWADRYQCLDDKSDTTSFDAHYIYHPAWVTRIIVNTKPSTHVDIASTLHFCSMVSAFVPVEFYDYRPVELTLNGLNCNRGDLMNLPFPNGSVESLSCMHVIEHVGLGRYGDPLDPDGDLKAIAELIRVLAKGGNLLFVTPVGMPVIRYNAHRIYSYNQIVSYFSGLKIRQFALVDDKGRFVVDANKSLVGQQKYGCGCWWFTK